MHIRCACTLGVHACMAVVYACQVYMHVLRPYAPDVHAHDLVKILKCVAHAYHHAPLQVNKYPGQRTFTAIGTGGSEFRLAMEKVGPHGGIANSLILIKTCTLLDGSAWWIWPIVEALTQTNIT